MKKISLLFVLILLVCTSVYALPPKVMYGKTSSGILKPILTEDSGITLVDLGGGSTSFDTSGMATELSLKTLKNIFDSQLTEINNIIAGIDSGETGGGTTPVISDTALWISTAELTSDSVIGAFKFKELLNSSTNNVSSSPFELVYYGTGSNYLTTNQFISPLNTNHNSYDSSILFIQGAGNPENNWAFGSDTEIYLGDTFVIGFTFNTLFTGNHIVLQTATSRLNVLFRQDNNQVQFFWCDAFNEDNAWDYRHENLSTPFDLDDTIQVVLEFNKYDTFKTKVYVNGIQSDTAYLVSGSDIHSANIFNNKSYITLGAWDNTYPPSGQTGSVAQSIQTFDEFFIADGISIDELKKSPTEMYNGGNFLMFYK